MSPSTDALKWPIQMSTELSALSKKIKEKGTLIHESTRAGEEYDHVFVYESFRFFYSLENKKTSPKDKTSTRVEGVPDYIFNILHKFVVAKILFTEGFFLRDIMLDGFFYSKGARYIDLKITSIPVERGLVSDRVFDQQHYLVADSRFSGPSLSLQIHNDLHADTATPIHELFHLFQYDYCRFNNMWFMEGLARWSQRIIQQGSGKVENLPQSKSELCALLKKWHEAEYFWNRLTDLCDPEPTFEMPESLSDGDAVVNNQRSGSRFMPVFLAKCSEYNKQLSTDESHRDTEPNDYWSRIEKRSANNNPYILRAIKESIELVCVEPCDELKTFIGLIDEIWQSKTEAFKRQGVQDLLTTLKKHSIAPVRDSGGGVLFSDYFECYSGTLSIQDLDFSGASLTNADLQTFSEVRNIIGDFTLSSSEELWDLSGLDNLESVEGNFLIKDIAVSTIEGINKLTTIKGKLAIENNRDLREITGFKGLSIIDRSLVISGNSELRTVSGFANLETLKKGSLTIESCRNLVSITGLKRLVAFRGLRLHRLAIRDIKFLSEFFQKNTSYPHSIVISETAIETVDCMEGLKEVGSSFYLHHNEIENLRGLSQLQNVGASFSLAGNNLKNLKGLEKLSKVNGSLSVVNNNLVSLDGIESLSQLKTAKWNGKNRTLAIFGNPSLRDISSLGNIGTNEDYIIFECDRHEQYKSMPDPSSRFTRSMVEFHDKSRNEIIPAYVVRQKASHSYANFRKATHLNILDYLIDFELDSDILVISFAGFNGYLGGLFHNRFPYITEGIDTHKIFLTDKSNKWYQGGLRNQTKSLAETLDWIGAFTARRVYRKIICVGASMGGYMALVVGRHVGATDILAISPQSFLDDATRSEYADRRWAEEISAINVDGASRFLNLQGSFENAPEVNIQIHYAAKHELDALHANHLNLPKAQMIAHDVDDHYMALYLHKNELLENIVKSVISSPAPNPRPSSHNPTQNIVYVFSPHQDDETFGCGGRIAQCIAAGLTVKIVFLTDGGASHTRLSRANATSIVGIRRREAVEAASVLGVSDKHLFFLDYPDGQLSRYRESAESELLNILSPDIPSISEVYVPHIYDTHRDHKATYLAVLNTLEQLCYRATIFAYPIWGDYRNLGHSKAINVDISEFLAQKKMAVSKYVSQTSASENTDAGVVLSRSFVKTHTQSVEAFYKIDNHVYDYSFNLESLSSMQSSVRKRVCLENHQNLRWAVDETISGDGSRISRTSKLRELLAEIVRNASDDRPLVFCDLGCGDTNWVKEVDWGDSTYIGIDIVSEIIDQNIGQHTEKNFYFRKADIVTTAVPKSDYIICKDVFTHLTLQDCVSVLQNVIASGSRYLIATSHVEDKANEFGSIRGWTKRSLHLPPFSFPEPDEYLYEKPGDVAFAVWEIDKIVYPDPIEPSYYRVLNSRSVFSQIAAKSSARRGRAYGTIPAEEVKFLITGIASNEPQLYFMNTKRFISHHHFNSRVLGSSLLMKDFEEVAYSRDDRLFLAGSVVRYQLDGEDVYTIDFWPGDPMSFGLVLTAWSWLTENMSFLTDDLYFHIASETQAQTVASNKSRFEKSGIRLIESDQLFAGATYSAHTLGRSVGTLRIAKPGDVFHPSDIVVFRTIPNDLNHVSGIVSDLPQTPLSHVNLIARQNNIPNAFIKDASRLPEFIALNGEVVEFAVSHDGYSLTKAKSQDLGAISVPSSQNIVTAPSIDWLKNDIRALADIGFNDSDGFGSKASNLAEALSILPSQNVPDGYAIPFFYYHSFMRENGLYETIAETLNEDQFSSDIHYRRACLSSIRSMIRKAEIPAGLATQLDELHRQFPADTKIRARSSTNNEDLINFTGAGLYDSYSHKAGKANFGKTVKKVWAGLWTFRAFEERTHHNINHFDVAMAVLVHAAFVGEKANGIAVTKDIFNLRSRGMYINAQPGEFLVTNPDKQAVPEEILLSYLEEGSNDYEVQYLNRSNLLPGKARVLEPEQLDVLESLLTRVHSHFSNLYQASKAGGDFALDIEFKVTSDGTISIKQVRPWL